ncbi:MAG: leucyl aminopeptidase [Patescibacteria group bacterium]
MEISVKKAQIQEKKCDALVVDLFYKENQLSGACAQVDKELGGLLSKIIKEDHFKGKLGSVLSIRTNGLIPAKRVFVVGLGERKELNEEAMRCASASALNSAKAVKAKSIVSVLHGLGIGKKDPKLCAKAMVEGARLADYTFGKYKKHEKNSIKTFEIVLSDAKSIRSIQAGIELGEIYAKGTIFARDLVNTPGLHMHPAELVKVSREIAKGNTEISVRAYDKTQLKKMGAGGVLGVAHGSDHEPFLVHMIYKPKIKTKKKIALVGKAITFDSGGLSLKPNDFMVNMKIDMAGAASVLGAFSVIKDLAPAVEVHGIFAACENMPSGKAVRPGDVLTLMNKKTIEILNTDAEGRVVLADSLVYACKQKPDAIIDIATLTGACMVALGEEVSGLMSNNKKLTKQILDSAFKAGEKMWELPLEKRYKAQIKSEVADYKNMGDRYGGALTAGLLLEEFVDKMPWVHLDIGGPAFAEKPLNQYTKRGATGHGVRTLLEFLISK